MEESESVDESIAEQCGHASPFLICEACAEVVGLRILDVYFLVRHVHVAANDDRLHGIKLVQMSLKCVFPLHAVAQPAWLAPFYFCLLRVWRINAHEVEVWIFKRDDAAFVVVLLNAKPVDCAQWVVLGVDGCAAVAFALAPKP